MPDTVAVLTNPTAGTGRGCHAGEQVLAALRAEGLDVVDVTSATARQARAAADAAVAAGAAALVVVGGDGAVHLGTQVCAGTQVALGVVAAGTGNDVARGLGLPVGDVAAGVRQVLAGLGATGEGAGGRAAHRRQVDAVRVEPVTVAPPPPDGLAGGQAGREGASTWFVGVLAAGFDAVVNERANDWRWPRGRMRYNLAVLRELPVFRPIRYRLTLDGHTEEVSAMLVAVANGPSYGGGMRVAPDARYDDGLLDVLVLRPVGKAEFVRVFPRVFAGSHVDHPQVSIRRARTVRLEPVDRRVVGYADGESVGPLPVVCEVVPGALTVLAPAAG
ncbi:diacylglycerol kinase family protein [Thalassiella azotivora]